MKGGALPYRLGVPLPPLATYWVSAKTELARMALAALKQTVGIYTFTKALPVTSFLFLCFQTPWQPPIS
jgi:hypothetical protein